MHFQLIQDEPRHSRVYLQKYGKFSNVKLRTVVGKRDDLIRKAGYCGESSDRCVQHLGSALAGVSGTYKVRMRLSRTR